MAKAGKLTKLKSVLKKLNSFNSKQTRPSGSSVSAEHSSGELHPVYVGKSRRRYLISSDIIDHPLFRELAERSSATESDHDCTISIACEVVLFEHLLWMLENADSQAESLDELVEFYAC
ncbi:auxin-responsive protein SAUR76 [Mercurialis annua]|uniref:auxin-responsive protein SAUR76 n=1 Tax=Mercurialis annua TaxID=3986 RepID=UPI00215EA4DB|nr:auxin-responsive protein SAUR76 [Mercurialis annua]